MFFSTARSSRSPSREMPSPYRMSNSASRNGGATLFFTIFAFVRLPTTSSPSLMEAMRRTSTRTEAVELQRAAAGCGFGIAEHDADLFADLVDEDQACFGFRNDAGEFAQSLRHQAGLKSHLRVAHFAFEFGARNERGDRVDDDDIDGAAADQDFGDFQSLFAAVGLRDQQVVDIDAELARVVGIQRMFGVDEGGRSAELLRFGDGVQRQRGFAARFRSEDFDDAAAGIAADAECGIQRQRSGGDRIHAGSADRCRPAA